MPDTKKKSTAAKTTSGAKKKTAAKAADAKSAAAKKTAAKAKAEAAAKSAPVREVNPDSIANQIIPYLLVIAALFIAVCFLMTGATGVIGGFLRSTLYGLFAGGACAVPLFILVAAFFWKKDTIEGIRRWKLLFAFICLVLISVLLHVFTGGGDSLVAKALWENGQHFLGGGVIGGVIGGLLLRGFGKAGTLIIGITALVVFILFLFGLTPHTLRIYIQYYFHKKREENAARREAEASSPKQKPKVFREPPVIPQEENASQTHGKFNTNVALENEKPPIDDNPYNIDDTPSQLAPESAPTEEEEASQSGREDTIVDEGVFDEVIRSMNDSLGVEESKESEPVELPEDLEILKPERNLRTPDGRIDLAGIFTDPEENNGAAVLTDEGDTEPSEATAELELTVERRRIIQTPATSAAPLSDNTPEENEAPTPKPYQLPPMTLLKLERPPSNTDISEELHANATKLVETLRSFKVRTRIVNISRGPTITRYELAPEEGVKVRSIVNLVDDIALNLATSGVRIEAPIPGKAAVGIEVPNKVVATVWLRELFENPRFAQNQSKVCVSLGMDVAGEPIFMDIAKMPHVLIAGATGMGKSVCINCILMSLLFKATPDEVKLILIDPKKVELNIYNGLPHLLVPVVSEPKKAAGALHWAVTEMERRYELIEGEGVRDLKSYNAAIADDPDKEQLPQIVIVIDEFADLMMTAPDDVEDSVCRIAQKARAAGMHLIIGTQRPQVSVITGLIKANIPSRIAFTVSSQIDSNTILGMGGAERLIGRGDMLFAPVGMAKPLRVQGAFVTEQEVEAVCDFIKRQTGEGEYDTDVMAGIEREAARCDKPKKGGGSFDDAADDDSDFEGDSMLKPAIELAVESGKISTSLIQRRLQLGYGRAAKLIDRMEEMGIVSAPEGQKPRKVLISKQEYMEMVLRNDDI